MSERKIEVIIDPLGRPKIEAIGFHGVNCGDATKGIEQALAAGGGQMEREYKPEWNEQEHEVTVAEQYN